MVHKPDIFFLNETHVTEDCDISDLKIKNYYLVNCLSHSNHTGGVCAFINNKLKYTNVSVSSVNIAWYLSFEILINNKCTVLACVYLSSQNEHKQLTLNSFENWFNDISTDKNVMICGDFNIDWFSHTTHCRRLKNFCSDNGLSQLVQSPTRIIEYSITLIDLCISNISSTYINCSVLYDDKISDHEVLAINIFGQHNILINKTRQVRVFENYDTIKLCDSIENCLWEWDILKDSELDVKVNWLLNILKNSISQFVTFKIFKTGDNFFDNEIEQMRIEKNRLYKIAQFSMGSSESANKWQEFKMFKNLYKKTIQLKKYECNQRKLNRAHGDSKATWKILNSILNKEHSEIVRIKCGDIELEDDKLIALEFNKYFINSIVNLNSKIPYIEYEEEAVINPNISFEFHGVSIVEIKNCLRSLKSNTDEFHLNSRILLDAMFVVGIQVVNIINESFSSGIFPYALKKSTIHPIQKKTGSIKIDDHRPINLLPLLERLIESLAYNQLSFYINQNKLLSDNQSGFRANHSCETAINDVLFDWRAAQNNNKTIIAVFLDFQRAFETIEPKILIKKLAKYGVRSSTLDWFNSYISNRRQVVKMGQNISDELTNNLGVPQGSILGPLLFSLYINNISKCLKSSTAKLFADDTLIYIISDNIDDAIEKLNIDLQIIYNMLCQNKLKLNINKTKVMVVSAKNIDRNSINISLNGNRLEIEKEIKYLGVIIDDTLSFDKNIDHICKKIGMKLSVLGRLRNDLNVNQKLQLYKSLVEPHFTYCASILYLSNRTDLERLQILQNKCLRVILKASRFTNSNELTEILNLRNVQQLIIFQTLLLIFKIVKGIAPEYLSNRINYKNETQTRMLRNSNEINLTNASKACSQNSLFYKGIKLFNSLPNDIKNAETISKYKKLLNNHIKDNY